MANSTGEEYLIPWGENRLARLIIYLGSLAKSERIQTSIRTNASGDNKLTNQVPLWGDTQYELSDTVAIVTHHRHQPLRSIDLATYWLLGQHN
jgi:hypothetical protein